MSEPKRYDVGMTTENNPHGFNHSFPRVYEAEQGKYVEYADYARLKAEVEELTGLLKASTYYNTSDEVTHLKAEVERLKAEKDQVECDYDNCHKKLVRIDDVRCDLFMEVKRLEAEVERLTKAGDAVCESPYLWETDPAVIAWRAAKEGKPQS